MGAAGTGGGEEPESDPKASCACGSKLGGGHGEEKLQSLEETYRG